MQIKFNILLKIFMVVIMENRIDLNNFNIRTDLVIDSVDKIEDKDVVEVTTYDKGDIHVSKMELDKDNKKYFNKEEGKYITIEFPDITNFDDREVLEEVLESELEKIFADVGVGEDDSCLVIGLGNAKSTPDSLGPKVIQDVMVTRHLFLMAYDQVQEGMRNVCAFSPGVMGNTGLESADIILDIVKDIKPKFLIVVDALASNSIDRINRTIQITDSGINPGSGIGNNRKEISKRTIGIPVIAIGIPTVVDASTVIGDTIQYLYKHISYIKSNYDKDKLVFTRKNYLSKIRDRDLSKEEKKEVGGMLGELSEEELKELFDEVLTSIDYNMMVTVKEIDFVIEKLSIVVSSSLNNSLHRNVTHY